MDTVLPFDQAAQTATNFLCCYLIQQTLQAQATMQVARDGMLQDSSLPNHEALLREFALEEEQASRLLQETANRLEKYFGVCA
tara:strand:+ start:1413 stop:1661 length:249 start_codon:yes stop_codon:yes gene_type:complete